MASRDEFEISRSRTLRSRRASAASSETVLVVVGGGGECGEKREGWVVSSGCLVVIRGIVAGCCWWVRGEGVVSVWVAERLRG